MLTKSSSGPGKLCSLTAVVTGNTPPVVAGVGGGGGAAPAV